MSLILSLLLLAGMQDASAASTPAPAANPPAAADADKKVCVEDPVTGTRLKRSKICHTKAEWAEIRAQNSEVISRAQRERTLTGN